MVLQVMMMDNYDYAHKYMEEIQFLNRLNNIIQNKKEVSVKQIRNPSDLAFTDLYNVYINFNNLKSQIKQFSKNAIQYDFDRLYTTIEDSYSYFLILLKALNYHELCHIMYTKYSVTDEDIGKHPDLAYVMNILEDQRIENILAQKYLKASYYFRFLYYKYLIQELSYESSYLMLYGRRTILENDRLMNTLRQNFLEKTMMPKENIPRALEIIDTYIVTTDVDRQKELGKEFCELLDYMSLQRFKSNSISESQALNVRQKRRVTKEERDALDEIRDALRKKRIIDGRHGLSSEDADAKKNRSKREMYGENHDIYSSKSQKDSKTMSEIIEQIKNDISSDMESTLSETMKDVDTMKKHMNKYDYNSTKYCPSSKRINETKGMFYQFNPDVISFKKIRSVERAINRLRIDLDNKTYYRQKRGKISMRHAMMSQSYELKDFKRQYQSRRNDVNIDLTMLIDSSDSIRMTQYKKMMEVAWIISKAVENMNGRTQVYEFSARYECVKKRSENTESALWGRRFSNGTFPLDAITKIFEDYHKNKHHYGNPLFFFITDGQYSTKERQDVNKTVDKLRQEGVYCVWIYIDSEENGDIASENIKHFNRFLHVKSFNELNTHMTSMLYDFQRKVIAKKNRIGERYGY